MLGGPPSDLPPLTDEHMRAFWRRFDAAAPIHLRAGVRVATTLLSLPPGDPGRNLARAERLPGAGQLVELVRLVACFAYFSDPDVDAGFRRTVR